jgi:hypothetical protein
VRFNCSPVRVRQTRTGPKFRVGRLTEIRGKDVDNVRHSDVNDVTHLVDRTYDYASPRELRWHLAERFELSPEAVTLTIH